jgi:hypothetical protein
MRPGEIRGAGSIKGAFTLIEVIVSIAIIVMAFFIFINIFHASLRYNSWVEQQFKATEVARRWLEKVRTEAGYDFEKTWAVYSGLATHDPEHLGLSVRIDARDDVLYSPSSAFEKPLDAVLERRLDKSVKKVRVVVGWDPLDASRSVSLYSLVSEPARHPLRIEVERIGGSRRSPLRRDDFMIFAARAVEVGENTEVQDLFYHWYVVPGTGYASVEPARDGRTARFINRIPLRAGGFGYEEGTCRILVRAVYQGIEYTGESRSLRVGSGGD